MSDNKFDLRGLDTFSQPQAAHYMNRSLAKFKQTVKLLGIPHFYVDGIKTFRSRPAWSRSVDGYRRRA